MLDYYSYYPGPTHASAKKEIVHYFPNAKYVADYYARIILDDINCLGSATGWNCIVKNDVITKVKNLIQTGFFRRIRIKIVSLMTFNRLFFDIHYAPVGEYEKQMKHKYKHFLWNPPPKN